MHICWVWCDVKYRCTMWLALRWRAVRWGETEKADTHTPFCHQMNLLRQFDCPHIQYAKIVNHHSTLTSRNYRGPKYQNFDSQNQIDTFLLSVNFHFIAREKKPNLGAHQYHKVQIYYEYYVVRLCHKHNENKQEHKQDNKYLDDEPAIGWYAVQVLMQLSLSTLHVQQCVIHVFINPVKNSSYQFWKRHHINGF